MDLKTESAGRRVQFLPPLIWPFNVKKEANYALCFVILVVSSVVFVGLVSPLDPRILLRFGFLSGNLPRHGVMGCDYSVGRWVRDVTESSWQYNESCPFSDPGFKCRLNGRTDFDYLKWRWQPNSCDLPRFNATDLLERTRNGRIVFAGDSIGRNQWESLVCMLSMGVTNKSAIYEVNGNPITKHKGYLSMRFQDYNLTVEYYRVPFLVTTGRAPKNSSSEVHVAIRVDKMHWYSTKWVGADVMVFNAGHWWNPDKTTKMGCYFQEGAKINETLNVKEAFEKSILTWKMWAMKNIDRNRTRIFFRSFSPVHYSNGSWDEGGKCSGNVKPETDYMKLEPDPPSNRYVSSVIEDMDVGGSRAVQFLDITYLTEPRKDAHPSNHREAGTPPDAPEDCSHWCLPGVPDTWNELLYAHLLSSGFKEK